MIRRAHEFCFKSLILNVFSQIIISRCFSKTGILTIPPKLINYLTHLKLSGESNNHKLSLYVNKNKTKIIRHVFEA